MAQKRMLSKSIVESDLFLDMPISARLLYYDFCIRADDDGFIDAPTKILKLIGCSEDDLRILIAKKYLIPFESKVCVITHWLIHNTIRRDRYNPTIHIDERNQLKVINKVYDFNDEYINGNHLATNWQPSIEENSSSNSNNISSENNIHEIIEKEFGRTLSPMEYETINEWDYPIEILKLAVKEASTSGNFSIKYIDRIIFNWKKANIKSVNDVKVYISKFNEKKEKNRQPKKQVETIGTSCYEEL